jgi:hypothetical protein
MLSPLLGSPERLVIGVVAAGDDDFHVERANALRRFECLYGKAAPTAIFAAEVAIEELEADLAKRGLLALTDPRPSFSGVSIGPLSEGQAETLQEMARSWLSSISSLNEADHDFALELMAAHSLVSVEETAFAERLPSLVFQYVSEKHPTFERFFSFEIREKRRRRRQERVHGVIIDFAGSHLVANFGTLLTSRQAASVDKIKRRMFDLIVSRDSDDGTMTGIRSHEMIVQHPRSDDPQLSERQVTSMNEALSDLSEQAEKEELALKPLISIAEIGDHLLRFESGVTH